MSDYLTSSQAAKILGVSRSTLLNWQASGKLSKYGVHPIQTLGGQYRYKVEEIEALVRALTTDHPSAATQTVPQDANGATQAADVPQLPPQQAAGEERSLGLT